MYRFVRLDFFIFFLLFQMSRMIIPINDHYIGRVPRMGQVAMKTIKDKFEDLKLLERAKECPFKQFFQAQHL